jgi:hypothetical protein
VDVAAVVVDAAVAGIMAVEVIVMAAVDTTADTVEVIVVDIAAAIMVVVAMVGAQEQPLSLALPH